MMIKYKLDLSGEAMLLISTEKDICGSTSTGLIPGSPRSMVSLRWLTEPQPIPPVGAS